MADLLIYALPDNAPYDPNQSRRGYAKGGIVAIKETGQPWGGKDGPPNFVRLTIIDRTRDQVIQYLDHWYQVLDFRVDQHQPNPNDRYDAAIIAANKRASDGLGGVSLAQVESYLARWNINVQNASAGEVNVRFFIAQVATSPSFWNADVGNIVFNEISYNSGTGVHRIEADYSTTVYPSGAVENRIGSVATVVSHDTTGRVITYDISRDEVLAIGRASIREDVEMWVAKRRWYFDPAQVDAALSQGGIITRTAAQVAPFLLDALAD